MSEAEPSEQVEGRIHAEHQKIALSEIDDAHDPVNESEADTHEAVDAADQNAGRKRLQDVLCDDQYIHWYIAARIFACSASVRLP